MRDDVFERLTGERLGAIGRDTFDVASGYVDEQLGYEITRAVFGPVAEARRRALSDRQMQTAVRLLRRGRDSGAGADRRRGGAREDVLAVAH